MSVPSPCIRNCCLSQDDVCLGCFRTLHEITQWTYLNDAEKKAIIEESKQRQQAYDATFGRWK